MKRILLALIIFSIGTVGYCTKWTITNSGYTFSPETKTITSGDSVLFSITSMHNAVEVSHTTWNANGSTPLPGFSTPYGGGLVLPAQLAVGTHYYVCTPHAAGGMKGTIIVQTRTGIDVNETMPDFSVYTNLSRGIFNVEISSVLLSEKCTLGVFDLRGVKVYSESNSSLQTSNLKDLSNYHNGMYLVKLTSGSNIFVQKLIVQ